MAQQRGSGCGILMLIIGGVVWGLWMFSSPHTNRPAVQPVATKSVQGKSRPTMHIGDLGKLGYVDGKREIVLVAIQDSGWDDMLKAMNANDFIWLARLVEDGKVKQYPVGTKVRVIGTGMFSRRVIVTDGPDIGDTGWVQYEFVLPR